MLNTKAALRIEREKSFNTTLLTLGWGAHDTHSRLPVEAFLTQRIWENFS
jgi:hypothetical protein